MNAIQIMLKHLSINNYALISQLEIEFKSGFSTITGETGAGKSILLGAIELILGKRADTNSLRDKSKKCIIEGVFDIKSYNLNHFFQQNEIDFSSETIIRREISISGSSRAFINDSQVNLNVLKELGEKLIDIHSQHDTLLLNQSNFQLTTIDNFSGIGEIISDFKKLFNNYKLVQKKINEISEKEKKAKLDFDYNQFLFNELNEIKFDVESFENAEQDLETLNNAESIKYNLNQISAILSHENAVIDSLKNVKNLFEAISSFNSNIKELKERLISVLIEIQDINKEAEQIEENLNFDPEEFEILNQKINQVNNLLQKHRVLKLEELFAIKSELEKKLSDNYSLEKELELLKNESNTIEKELFKLAVNIEEKRKKSIPEFVNSISSQLFLLGMPHATIEVKIERLDHFNESGFNNINIYFSANKGGQLREIQKVASGGEMSRFMLAVKAELGKKIALPSIIFDEIDTGVSGEMATNMAKIMNEMAQKMQVISITHLPQIASKSQNQYRVYKEISETETFSNIILLNKDERVEEIAKMLSGEKLSKEAIQNAKSLMS